MATKSGPDLALPFKAPTERYTHENHDSDKFAVYTLVDLGAAGIDGLLKTLEDDDENLRDTQGLPPKYDFRSQSLKDVYDYHLKLGREKTHHPTLFIVAQNEDYKRDGVLLVDINFDLEGGVDTCRISASEALLAAVNVNIANMDWEDFKDEELPLPEASSGASGSVDAPSTTQPTGSTSVQTRPYPVIFAAYGIAKDVDMTAAHKLLEPDWQGKAIEARLCHDICSYGENAEPMAEVMWQHPWICGRNPRLHRQWCICVDSQNPAEEGVLLVQLGWDGNIERTPNELLKRGLVKDAVAERSPVGMALAMLKARTCGLDDDVPVEHTLYSVRS